MMNTPLVSCIMLTFNRRHLIPLALKSYLWQDWPARELVVIDDGSDCVADLFEDIPDVTYVRLPDKIAVGEKVNIACRYSRGEVIATWDDDDFSAPNRLTDQVTRLLDSGKALTGYSTMLFWDEKHGKASRYLGMTDYATGTSQVYLKSFWQRHPSQPKDVAYDNDIWREARNEGQVVCVEGRGMMVARIHGRNVSGERKAIGSEMWPEVPVSEIPQAFFEALRCAS